MMTDRLGKTILRNIWTPLCRDLQAKWSLLSQPPQLYPVTTQLRQKAIQSIQSQYQAPQAVPADPTVFLAVEHKLYENPRPPWRSGQLYEAYRAKLRV